MRVIEWVFLSLLLLELGLKLFTYGLHDFFRHGWNVFDFVISLTAVVGSVLESVAPVENVELNRLVDILIVIRVFRLLKV